MRELFNIKGFPALSLVLFLNTFSETGFKVLLQNLVYKLYDGRLQVILTACINALILLPFILLFSPAGFITDKHPKENILRLRAAIALAALLMTAFFYYHGWFWPLLTMMFVMGLLSVFYSPAKYGYLCELAGEQKLSQANGFMQAIGVSAVLSGTLFFSWQFERQISSLPITSNLISSTAPLTGILIALTFCEFLLCRRLPSMRTTDTNKEFLLRPYLTGHYFKSNSRLLTNNRLILISILGLSIFWATSQALLAAFPAFAKATLANDNTIISQGIMACTAIGLIIGTLTAGRRSKEVIEVRLVPIAAFGLALMIGVLPQLKTALSMALSFTVIGLLGGLFIVPLLALIQFHAADKELGTVLAGNNWVQNMVMVMFLGLTILFVHLGVNSIQLFYGLMMVALLGATYMLYEFSHSFKNK